MPDKQRGGGNQLFTSLLRRGGGWFANHTLQRRPAGQLDGSGNLFAIVAADRAFPAAVAGR